MQVVSLSETNPVDPGRLQISEPDHGRLGYRQPDYVNQDTYITGSDVY